MTTDALVPLAPVLRIGRKRTTHSPRVLIEDGAVVLRTRCGLDPLPDGFTETFEGLIGCDECRAAWEAAQ
jgi:hypothetical protein